MLDTTHTSGRVMAGLALGVLQAARARGADLVDVLQHWGLSEAQLTRSDAYVPVALHEQLWADGAARLGDALFGLRAAEHITPGQTGVIEYILRNCETVEDAAQTWVRFASAVSDRLEGALVEVPGGVRLEWRLARPLCAATAQWALYAQARTVWLMRHAVGDRAFAPREVWFRQAAPPDVRPLEDYFLAPVRFGCPQHALVVSRESLARPLCWVDAASRTALELRARAMLAQAPGDGAPWETRVRAALQSLLLEPARDLRLEVVAERLQVRPRTVQQHLAAEGVGFRTLVAAVRAEAAQRWMDEGAASVAETARRLGYADAAALRKARRRWHAAQGERGRKR